MGFRAQGSQGFEGVGFTVSRGLRVLGWGFWGLGFEALGV